MLAPTPRDTVFSDGTARLYRFRAPRPVGAQVIPIDAPKTPVLLVPSMINRWYVLDLREGYSLVEALVRNGFDTYLLDWGAPNDEDRYLSWEDVLTRLGRMFRAAQRHSGAKRLHVLGYCMGATLSGIHAALEPSSVASLVNLLGPFDFSKAGNLAQMTDPQWFDADAVAEAGNVAPQQMQAGFVMLRPTQNLSKLVNRIDKAFDPAFRESFEALEAWASDNVSFPAEAYRTYIKELYQQNQLVQGQHHVRGRQVELSKIDCPVMTIAAERDAICPPDAAVALNAACSSKVKKTLRVPGGHVGAVVGSRAATHLYPKVVEFFQEAAS
ncbi:MAG: alpha/beta fold hydrolase [Myxococcaceae bacterium]